MRPNTSKYAAIQVLSAMVFTAPVCGPAVARAEPATARPRPTGPPPARPVPARPRPARLTHRRALQQARTGTTAKKLAAVRFLIKLGTPRHQKMAFDTLDRIHHPAAKQLLFEVLHDALETEVKHRALMILAKRVTSGDRKKLAALHAGETDPGLRTLLAGLLAGLGASVPAGIARPAPPAVNSRGEKKPAKKRRNKWFSAGFIASFGGGLSAPLAFFEVGLALRWGRMTFDFRGGGGFRHGTVALAMGMFSVFGPWFRVRHGWTARFAAPTDFFYFGVWANLADFWIRLSRRMWLATSLLNIGWGNGMWQGTLELRMEF
jgi:hypothetical protein